MNSRALLTGDVPPFIIMSLILALIALAVILLKDIREFDEKFVKIQRSLDEDLLSIRSFSFRHRILSLATYQKFTMTINAILFSIVCSRIYMGNHFTEKVISYIDHIVLGTIWVEGMLLMIVGIYFLIRDEFLVAFMITEEFLTNIAQDDE